MTWHDEVIAGFPDPDDREPRSLRGDIADELADHLACAMQRELKRTDDENVARKKVLERFGDIQKITRQLWWDAMRDRIMKDRLFLIGTFVVMIALVAAFVMPWAAKQNEINAAILAKLEQIAKPPPPVTTHPAVPENWAKLTVRVMRGEQDGPVVNDATVSLKGQPFTNDAKPRDLREHTDSNGQVSYGPILPGFYELMVFDPVLNLYCNTHAMLYPGQAAEKIIFAPDLPAGAKLSFKVAPSDELQDLDAAIHCQLQPKPLQFASQRWEAYSRELILDGKGNILDPRGGKFSGFKRQAEGREVRPRNTFRVDNPLRQMPEIGLASLPYDITSARVAIPILSDGPASSAWTWSDAMFFILPDQPMQVETVAGVTSLVTLKVPSAVLAAARELRQVQVTLSDSDRKGLSAVSLADPQWQQLTREWRTAREKAIELARSHGDQPVTQQAYEEANRAEDRLWKRASELSAHRPCRSDTLNRNGQYVRASRERDALGNRLKEIYAGGAEGAEFKEIAERYKQVDEIINRLCLQAAVADAQREMPELIQKYGAEHPRVADQKKYLSSLEQELQTLPENSASAPSNPAE